MTGQDGPAESSAFSRTHHGNYTRPPAGPIHQEVQIQSKQDYEGPLPPQQWTVPDATVGKNHLIRRLEPLWGDQLIKQSWIQRAASHTTFSALFVNGDGPKPSGECSSVHVCHVWAQNWLQNKS
ncbi:uncharacterized protein LOC144597688 [Rhinoraja longicauda]